jgi:hypothetical protein|nr:Ig-like domain-containing protein [Kofleriaceae bacterium]
MIKLGFAVGAVALTVAASAQADRRAVCNAPGHTHQCLSYISIDHATGKRRVPAATPAAGQLPTMTATAIEEAYNIDPTIDPHATIAVIDAYGYPSLEADLAQYRALFHLPPCTVASGCLTIVNQEGATSPLPAQNTDPNDDWTVETALDVDMASAGCPLCKILVVQADDDMGDGLDIDNDTAASLGATVISNSWSIGEGFNTKTEEAHFTHSGISIFASTGDNGEGSKQYGLPSTSTHVVAVGGTTLTLDPAAPRGWDEAAWSDGGSFCSSAFAQPTWQSSLVPSSVCANRATSDVSAVADEQIPIINGGQEFIVAGTSASSPLTAAIFALTGNHTVQSDFPYTNATDFNDITAGTNGSCKNLLCQTGSGWDGPTGVGSPMAPLLAGAKLPAFAMTPAAGATLPPGFEVDVTCTSNDSTTVKEVDIGVDGTQLSSQTAPPFSKKMPTSLADGPHQVFGRCIMSTGAVTGSIIAVTQDVNAPPQGSGSGSGSGSGGGGGGGGGCDTGGGGGGALLLGLGVVGLAIARRRTK